MTKPRYFLVLPFLVVVVFANVLQAKNESPTVMTWPSDNPVLQLKFEKFRQVGNYAVRSAFVTETVRLCLAT
jgi:hypothetical protein